MTDQLPLWTDADAAAATHGQALGTWSARGVSIDTRTMMPGDLFIALRGPNHDGHAYVADALSNGASAALVDHVPDGVQDGLLVVDDVVEGLNGLGIAARNRSNAQIVGVTGSVGKTGTKELLSAALGAFGSVSATAGNLNNHFGLPLSLARVPREARFGVFEMGMNHAGEISPLSKMARPHVAIITAIEPVHIEFFESVEGIADAKAEIFDGVEPGGTVVLNKDNPHFERVRARADHLGIDRILCFGRDASADARLIDYTPNKRGAAVAADICGTRVTFDLAMPGAHWAMNAMAVLAAVHALGHDVTAAAGSLAAVAPVIGRGALQTVDADKGTFSVIDETYNASPPSMRAAFDVLSATAPVRGGRRIVVLGDMLELGGMTEEAHLGLADDITAAGIDLAFACGTHMPPMLQRLPTSMRGGVAQDAATLAPLVCDAVQGGDVIMAKGSAGSRMRIVVDALRAMDTNRKDKGDA